jgi:membrane AbrB-like protein
MRRTAPWLGLGAVIAAGGWALEAIGVPSSFLFAALLVGIGVALRWPDRLAVRPRVFTAAQALTGVALGTYLQSSALGALADDWLPVALVSAATLGLSVVSGLVLARLTEVDEPTAALGMIAGGATGIVGIARELGGDDRMVAFMQYLRVLIVVLLTPVLVAVLFPGHHLGVVGAEPVLGDAAGWLLAAAVAAVGVAVGTRVRIPAGVLLGPMVLAAVVTFAGVEFAVPPLLRETAFAVLGLQVGLRFTVETIRMAGRLLVPVLLAMVVLLVTCFGLALALSATTSVPLLDAYLATTPGGLYAVMAAAVGAGANTTFIVGVQGLRLFVMVLVAPAAVRGVLRLRARPAAA